MFERYFTVRAMDRRGRGASGDAATYDGVREFEDVAAVVDAVAETSGTAVDVLGHSFGGFCAFGAATLTSNIRKLVLYEGWPAPKPQALAIPPGLQERMDALVAEGERERFERGASTVTQQLTRMRLLDAELLQNPDRLAEHYEELAHHFFQGEEWQKAIDYSLLAGDRAAHANANANAQKITTLASGQGPPCSSCQAAVR